MQAYAHTYITSAGQSEEYQCAVMFSAALTFHFGCATLSLTSLLRWLLVFWLHQVSCGRGPQSLHLICAVFSSEHTARGEEENKASLAHSCLWGKWRVTIKDKCTECRCISTWYIVTVTPFMFAMCTVRQKTATMHAVGFVTAHLLYQEIITLRTPASWSGYTLTHLPPACSPPLVWLCPLRQQVPCTTHEPQLCCHCDNHTSHSW